MQVNAPTTDTITVSLSNGDSGQYKLEWTSSTHARRRFITHAYGFINSTNIANRLSEGQCEYIVTPCFKPIEDKSEYE